jgi:hypothetical protein
MLAASLNDGAKTNHGRMAVALSHSIYNLHCGTALVFLTGLETEAQEASPGNDVLLVPIRGWHFAATGVNSFSFKYVKRI